MSLEPVEYCAEADAENFPALRQEFVDFVKAWTIGGMVLFAIGCFVFAMAGLLGSLNSGAAVLWVSIPLLAACVWMWRRQFVPVRWHGKPVMGRQARRWVIAIALGGMALEFASLAAMQAQAEFSDWLRNRPAAPPAAASW